MALRDLAFPQLPDELTLDLIADVLLAHWTYGQLPQEEGRPFRPAYVSWPIHDVNNAYFRCAYPAEQEGEMERLVAQLQEMNPWLPGFGLSLPFAAGGRRLRYLIHREGMHRHPLVGRHYRELMLGDVAGYRLLELSAFPRTGGGALALRKLNFDPF